MLIYLILFLKKWNFFCNHVIISSGRSCCNEMLSTRFEVSTVDNSRNTIYVYSASVYGTGKRALAKMSDEAGVSWRNHWRQSHDGDRYISSRADTSWKILVVVLRESEGREEQPGRRDKDRENGDAYGEESLGIFVELNTPVSLEAPHLCRAYVTWHSETDFDLARRARCQKVSNVAFFFFFSKKGARK